MRRAICNHSVRWAAAAASAMTVIWLASSAQPAALAATSAASGAVRAATAVIRPSSPADTGASDVSDLGGAGWEVQSSAVATQTGAQISTPGFSTSTWLPVASDDAGAPGTEIEALAQNGKCPGDTALQPVNQGSNPSSVFFSTNMRSCYGSMSKIGADTVAQFSVPWWWRTDFTPNLAAGQVATLIVNGVIGSANVWVNGQQVATSSTVAGAYTRFSFNITGLVRPGTNSLAIEVNPNNPTTMFTLDDVDWNQIPPDNNTGIQFPVQLAVDGALSDGNAHVVENNTADLSSSALTVKTDITNNTSSPQAGTVTATITPPGNGAPITVNQTVTVPASTTQTVTFSPGAFPALTCKARPLWSACPAGTSPGSTSWANDGGA
jgi:exo-1,4-beta-D-glucosaminidase